MQGRIWTVPNQITFLRLGFLPFFLILISYEHYRWALLILIIAGCTDGIDGLLARTLNQNRRWARISIRLRTNFCSLPRL